MSSSLGTAPDRAGGLSRPASALSPDERQALGRNARTTVPRSSHAGFAPSAARPDPIALLERQARTRVPNLVPIRYGRMLVSPFTFFRGAALIMASDLADTPRSGFDVQLCGDAHLSNFGMFASAERRLVFDINDFDETLPGPWEWDLKRLVTSLSVAGRENGYSPADRRTVALAAAREYRETMARLAGMSNLEVWYAQMEVDRTMELLDEHLAPRLLRRAARDVDRARMQDSFRALAKLTRVVDGEPRIAADPPLIVPIEDLVSDQGEQAEELMRSALRNYRRSLPTDRRHLLEQYRLVHVATKVVGVGSVGMRAVIGLFLGRDAGDPLFMQVKEAAPSVLEEYVRPSEYANAGHRVVAGQRLMQASGDILLGWFRATESGGTSRDFYVRQLKDWKGSVTIDALQPQGLTFYGRACAWALARAHARSGDRIAIAAYLGTGTTFDRAVADFAEAYADQNERDHRALVDAVASGRITAQTGV
jgi:uncharacterized protein (DUF2252 family)